MFILSILNSAVCTGHTKSEVLHCSQIVLSVCCAMYRMNTVKCFYNLFVLSVILLFYEAVKYCSADEGCSYAGNILCKCCVLVTKLVHSGLSSVLQILWQPILKISTVCRVAKYAKQQSYSLGKMD